MMFSLFSFVQKLDVLREGSPVLDSETQRESPSSALVISSDPSFGFKHRRSSSKWNQELSPASSTVTESTQLGELMSGSKVPAVCFDIILFDVYFYSNLWK